ncbi:MULTISPECIES: hypothetical protein [Pontibacillus]|uniref:Uncharacterized protein n=1 Tax=Pontibacillus chungwhensis TaxID=265426 RepID=A0ABY8UW99_9BACI|nr:MULTISPECIES: hypothetical protein [Pontibacillus]MCD5324164.1 hypothetical protein [Pontibacillus sp. HN14]WIF97777.1 hypothetical protein QNI29_18945 [Pontibacillus chungwhensis]
MKEIDQKITAIYKMLADEKVNYSQDMLTVVFGLTGGLLALVGLISIFVSLNSQHMIQKLREVMWGIMDIPTKYNTYDSGEIYKEFRDKFRIYEQIFDKQGTDFTNTILRVTGFTLYFTVFVWLVLGVSYLYESKFQLYKLFLIGLPILVATLIILGFARLLSNLSDYRVVSKLPKPSEFLSGKLTFNKEKDSAEVFSVYIAAILSKVYLKTCTTSKSYKLAVGLPFKFTEMEIKVEFYKGEKNENLTYHQSNYFEGYTQISRSNKPVYDDINSPSELEFVEVQKFHWHWINAEVFHPNPVILVTFIGEQGSVQVQYAFNIEELNEVASIDNANKGEGRTQPITALFPTVVNEVENNITSGSLLNN